MPHEEYKPKDKTVLRMSRDGAVEDNLTVGTSERISKRLEDAQLTKPRDDDAPIRPENADALPVGNTTATRPSVSELHAAPASAGSVVAKTIITHKIRKAHQVEALDGTEVMEKAAETAADKPDLNAPAPTKKIERLTSKAEKAHERLDAAREALPTRKVLKKERVFDDAKGKATTRLRFEDEIKKPKSQGKIQFEAEKAVRKVGDTLASGIHGKIHEVEQDNSAVEAAHRTEIVVEAAAAHYHHHRQSKANKPFEKVSRLEHKAEIADAKLNYERTAQEHPEIKKQDMNKHYQRQNIKKEYAAARKAGSQTAGTATTHTGKKSREKAADKVKEFFSKNKKVFVWIGAGALILVLLSAGISSCTAMFTSSGSAVIASSYLSEDSDMLGAEAQYSQMEADLQHKLDNYESLYPGYDEYHYDLDEIEHDPYVLISILSALHEGSFTIDEVQDTLQMLFEKQYILTETVVKERRYYIETDTWTDEDGVSHTDSYRVYYDYFICTVTLENFNLSHVPVYIMSQDQLSMYATYMSGVGNREDLFPNSDYVDKYITNPPEEYEVNAEYLSDAKFSTLIEEAEKYLNYPYVWGGSNPDTSFDCSGFVSYVLTNSGLVNTGRLGAQGLYNICSPVSSANAKPGDLIFFVGTYDTPGVSHVGIYVGDNVMLHCGDPIQYTSISSSYWQSHFYAFRRPNY